MNGDDFRTFLVLLGLDVTSLKEQGINPTAVRPALPTDLQQRAAVLAWLAERIAENTDDLGGLNTYQQVLEAAELAYHEFQRDGEQRKI